MTGIPVGCPRFKIGILVGTGVLNIGIFVGSDVPPFGKVGDAVDVELLSHVSILKETKIGKHGDDNVHPRGVT